MRIVFLALLAVGLGAAATLVSFASGGSESAGTSEPPADRVETSSDSTGARLLTERRGDRLHIRSAFVNAGAGEDTLTYELNVRRAGNAGTSKTTQSGRFHTTSGQTDTLSTVQVNVQPGDHLVLHLRVRTDDRLVDEERVERTVPAK